MMFSRLHSSATSRALGVFSALSLSAIFAPAVMSSSVYSMTIMLALSNLSIHG